MSILERFLQPGRSFQERYIQERPMGAPSGIRVLCGSLGVHPEHNGYFTRYYKHLPGAGGLYL